MLAILLAGCLALPSDAVAGSPVGLASPSGTGADPFRGVSECADGMDNDGDGRVDYDPGGVADDFGCSSANDNSESPNPQCADGIDNDADGKSTGSMSAATKGPFHGRHDDEANPTAVRGRLRRRFRRLVDYPDDPGCRLAQTNMRTPTTRRGRPQRRGRQLSGQLDNLAQADRDHDGRGNACDACPGFRQARPMAARRSSGP